MTATTPVHVPRSAAVAADPYYSNKSFYMMSPVAVLYSAFAHLVLFLAKPFPFHIPVTNVDDILPQHRFIASKGHANLAIVTGSNTGIGFETASSLVHQGYTVILACRSRDKGQIAADKINKSVEVEASNNDSDVTKDTSNKSVGRAEFLHPLDLSSLKSVQSFSQAFTEKYTHLNILVNNAGTNSGGKSIDGMDLCFQTNFVGHYLLTRLMLPRLLKAKNFFHNKDSTPPTANEEDMEAGRVVNLSSVTHHFAGCNESRNGGDDYTNKTGTPDAAWWRATSVPDVSANTYKESKLAALLFTHALNKRFKSEGLKAVSANPGSVNSDIWRNFPGYMDRVHRILYLDSKQGAATSIAGAVSKLPEGAVYLQPYWQPFKNVRQKVSEGLTNSVGLNRSFGNRWYSIPVPLTEMLGSCIGYAITEPRLPLDPDGSSDALWKVCEELVGGMEGENTGEK
jgi:NAD(P)-dependent dehydrogenase (short-subunit alcohol dehydrogenase family)